MNATVGRIVHYRTRPGGRCYAALVTDSRTDGGVSLLVCPPHETPYALDCRESDNGGWHWPEREGDSA